MTPVIAGSTISPSRPALQSPRTRRCDTEFDCAKDYPRCSSLINDPRVAILFNVTPALPGSDPSSQFSASPAHDICVCLPAAARSTTVEPTTPTTVAAERLLRLLGLLGHPGARRPGSLAAT